MFTKYVISPLLLTLLFSGCADKLPSQVFKKSGDNQYKDHYNNTIFANSNQIVNIRMDDASLCGLDEPTATNAGSLSNREVLFYADIHKNGIVESTHIISDLVHDVTECKSLTLTSPLFFRRSLSQGDYFEIVIKAYESDSTGLARMTKSSSSTIDSIESINQEASVNAFLSSIKTLLYSISDVLVSVTGKSIDTWVAQAHAKKVMEQYIYVVYDDTNKSTDENETAFAILGSDFVKVDSKDQNISQMKIDFDKKIADLESQTDFNRSQGSVLKLHVKKQSINQ